MFLFKIHLFPSLKFKNILKSRHFRTSFLLTASGLTTVYVIICVLFCTRNLFVLKENLETHANHAASSIQDIINSMKSSSVLIGSMPSVDLVLKNSSPSIDQLSQMIDDVSTFSDLYEYENIALFFYRSGRIYDTNSGIYYETDYYNKELIQTVSSMETDSMWFFSTANLRYYEGRREVPLLTYIRRLPIYESRARGYIVISFSLADLQEMCEEEASESPWLSAVYFQDQLLWSSSGEDEILHEGIAYSSNAEDDVRCSFYLTWKDQFNYLLPVLPSPVLYPAVLFLSFLVSVFYAAHMIRPVDALMEKLGASPYTKSSKRGSDEFTLLDTEFERISTQLSHARSVTLQNQQLIRDLLLHDLLDGRIEPDQLPEEYTRSGIRFPHSDFCLILIFVPGLSDLTDDAEQKQIGQMLCANAVSSFSILGACYALTTDIGEIAVILNTDSGEKLQSELKRRCELLKMHSTFHSSLQLLFSVVLCSSGPDRLHQAKLLAEQNFLLMSCGTENVTFEVQKEFAPSIDPGLPEQLVHCILAHDSSQLKKHADRFSTECLSKAASLAEAKKFTSIVLYSVFTSLLKLDITVKESMLNEFIQKTDSAQTIQECDNILWSCLACLTNSGPKMSNDSHAYVRKAVQYLELHYSEPLSIPQIAAHVGVSSVYLNKVFKMATEKTLSEYLNYYRISRSLELLAGSTETVNRISESVGYNDVRSYIRFFKKFYGMTPNEYRKSGADARPTLF